MTTVMVTVIATMTTTTLTAVALVAAAMVGAIDNNQLKRQRKKLRRWQWRLRLPSEVQSKMIFMGHQILSCHVPVVRSFFIL